MTLDDADPVLEAFAALRAASIVVIPTGAESGRWRIGDGVVSDCNLLRRAESRSLIEATEPRQRRADAEGPCAAGRPAAPGHSPAHPGRAHAGTIHRERDRRTRRVARPGAGHACDPRAEAQGGGRPRAQDRGDAGAALALRSGASRFATIRARSRRVTSCVGHSWQATSNAARAIDSG